MKETEAPEATLKHWAGLLGGIGGLVTTLLALITALLGATGPYPATIAALTALLLVAGLWWWRWPRLSAKNPDKPTIIIPEKVQLPATKLSLAERLVDVFRLESRENYQLRPWRRVGEAWLLLGLSAAAIVFAGGQLAPVSAELSGMYCPLAQNGDLRVIIATFNRPEKTEEPFFEQTLLNSMQKKFRNRALVCRYKRAVADYEKAVSASK